MSLKDKISELPQPTPGTVRLDDVLSVLAGTRYFEVKYDARLHGREPADDAERQVWEVLDTGWNFLRESAVRVVTAAVRDGLKDVGRTVPSDEEILEELTAEVGKKVELLDVAVNPLEQAVAYRAVFAEVLDLTYAEVSAALSLDGATSGDGE